MESASKGRNGQDADEPTGPTLAEGAPGELDLYNEDKSVDQQRA